MSIVTILAGHTRANKEAEGRKIGVLEAVSATGLDGLGQPPRARRRSLLTDDKVFNLQKPGLASSFIL